jgi:hypothetical protein
VREESLDIPWEFPGSPETFWSAAQEITSSFFGWFRSELSPEDYEAASREVLADARRRYRDGRVAYTANMIVATGER